MIDERRKNILTTREIELIKDEVEKQIWRTFMRLSISNYSLEDYEMNSQNRSLTKHLDGVCIHSTEEAAVLLEENYAQYEFENIIPSVTISTQDIPPHRPKKNALHAISVNDGNKCEVYIWHVIYFGTVIGVFWFAIFHVWIPMIKAIVA